LQGQAFRVDPGWPSPQLVVANHQLRQDTRVDKRNAQSTTSRHGRKNRGKPRFFVNADKN
jgi:hypothetical protein